MKNHSSVLALAILMTVVMSPILRPIAQGREDDALVREGARLFAKVWSVAEGLGPTFNARSCSGCHTTPTAGGSGTDQRAFVLVTPVSPLGSRVTRRLRIDGMGAVSEEPLPREGVLRRAPALFGSGVLEAVPDGEIGASPPSGRFGWKARFRTIDEAVAAAFENELGLVPGGEVSQEQVDAVSAFVRSLPPLPAGRAGPSEESGRSVFERIGCGTCHRASFGSQQGHGARPYTDLRLHDMGPALADGIREGAARPADFKTPPLWGVARTGPPYLHDGRAATLEDAIAAHAGEAEPVARAWRQLSPTDRLRLIAFLQSL